MTGMGSCSSAVKAMFSRASLRETTSSRTWTNSLMSEPAQNALLPDPVTTSTHPLVAPNVATGGGELVERNKGGEVERWVVEGEHHDAATLQTVFDEGALRHTGSFLTS